MLFKQTVWYFAARATPAISTVLGIAIYTRLLTPRDYGRYALVVSGVVLLNIAFFYWIKVALVRFYPARASEPATLLGSVLACYAITCAGLGALGAAALFLAWDDAAWRALACLGLLVLWAQGWFELNLSLCTARVRPLQFGMLSGVKAVLALCSGALLALQGAGPFGPLAGLLLGMLVATAFAWREWRKARPVLDPQLLPGLLRYGIPLAGSYMLACVVVTADRFLLAAYLGEEAAGRYAANADLAQQALMFVMMTVYFATYPLVVRSLDDAGPDAARHLAMNGTALLLAIAVPSTAGLVLLSGEIAATVLGESFHGSGVLPLLALATLMAGLKAYHFDLAFHLGLRTALNVGIWVLVVAINVGLNVLWIPAWGLTGAACASLAAYTIGLALSAGLGRTVFHMPFPWDDLLRTVGATAAMSSVILALPRASGPWMLGLQIAIAAFVYLVAAVALDVGGSRNRITLRWKGAAA